MVLNKTFLDFVILSTVKKFQRMENVINVLMISSKIKVFVRILHVINLTDTSIVLNAEKNSKKSMENVKFSNKFAQKINTSISKLFNAKIYLVQIVKFWMKKIYKNACYVLKIIFSLMEYVTQLKIVSNGAIFMDVFLVDLIIHYKIKDFVLKSIVNIMKMENAKNALMDIS